MSDTTRDIFATIGVVAVTLIFGILFAHVITTMFPEKHQCDLNNDGDLTLTDLSILAEEIRNK